MTAALAAPVGGITRAIVTGNQLGGLPLASSYNIFSSPIRIENATNKKECVNTTDQGGVFNIGNDSENTTVLNFVDSTRDTARIRFTSPTDQLSFSFYTPSSADQDAAVYASSTQHETCTLGRPSYLWKEVFASTGTINTSDSRCKSSVASASDALLDAVGNIPIHTFQFTDAVEKKGSDAARFHVGVIAQEVASAFEAQGLDAARYGLFCHDEWQDEYETVEVIDQPEVLGEDGEVVTPAVTHTEQKLMTAAGDRYGIRYEELLTLECARLRRELDRIKTALTANGITV